MNMQEIIVALIVGMAFLWAIRHIIHYIKHIKKKNTPCEGCNCGSCPVSKECSFEKK